MNSERTWWKDVDDDRILAFRGDAEQFYSSMPILLPHQNVLSSFDRKLARSWVNHAKLFPTDGNGYFRLERIDASWHVLLRGLQAMNVCVYIYIHDVYPIRNSRSLTDREFRQSIIWDCRARYENDFQSTKNIYKKRWNRVLDRAILLEEEQSKVIFILCHFLDNLIRSIIKFRVSQLNRRLEIEGTDNACLTTGKLHLLSLTRDQFY